MKLVNRSKRDIEFELADEQDLGVGRLERRGVRFFPALPTSLAPRESTTIDVRTETDVAAGRRETGTDPLDPSPSGGHVFPLPLRVSPSSPSKLLRENEPRSGSGRSARQGHIGMMICRAHDARCLAQRPVQAENPPPSPSKHWVLCKGAQGPGSPTRAAAFARAFAGGWRFPPPVTGFIQHPFSIPNRIRLAP